MIDDGVPEIAQALRLGHVLQDKVQETYSHVATNDCFRVSKPAGRKPSPTTPTHPSTPGA
jgi:hypothetical protein